jgi:hypothetical protein
VASPRLDLSGADHEALKALAAFLPQALRPGALDSRLEAMRFISAEDGWQARLSDGTVALWGDLRFTRQKLARLREVRALAREEFGGALAADLRYFEDGRLLIRPAGPSLARAGGT